MEIKIKNAVIEHFDRYNERRFSIPWVCIMNEDGSHDFTKKIGVYTGNAGEEGDLVVFVPVVDQVYGYGQKDYRGNRTMKSYAKWDGSKFIKCDKVGNIKSE